MPRTDVIHKSVKRALIKDGWQITHDPYTIEYKTRRVFADLGAERPFAAERAGEKIAVEVKSFIGASPLHEFENALGQYQLYQYYISKVEPERRLWLAVSQQVYNEFFTDEAIEEVVKAYDVSLIVVEIRKGKIVRWLS